MYRLALVIFLFISYSVTAQDYFNTEEVWGKLCIDEAASGTPCTSDTAIIVVSNRAKQKDKLRFMSEYKADKGLTYFFVYAVQDKWHVMPVASMEQAVACMPHKNHNWVVYTEGMGKIFTTDIYRGMSMAGQYNVNVIMLDYPSITTTKRQIGNYYFAIGNARNAYRDFVPVLDTIKQMRLQNKLGNTKLSLFFHSMGNNVVTETILNGKLPVINDAVWVDNLILNAPCVPESGHAKLLSQIKFARNIYVHYNPEDHTLKGAHLISLHRQLGEKVCNPICSKAYYINFNMLAGEGHSNFLSLSGRAAANKAAIRHYNQLLNGDTVQLSDTKLYRPSAYKHIGWDILP